HEEASAMETKALKVAAPEQLFSYGERQLREKGAAEARTFFTRLTGEHPEAWINSYVLAMGQSARGERTAAKKTLEDAARYAVQPQHKAAVKRLLERLAAGQ